MLMNGALERIADARGYMEDGESLEKHRLLSAAVQIVENLRSNLDVCRGGPLVVNLDDVYGYMSRQLVSANLQDRVATLDEVSDLLREVRSAWDTLTYV
jgi:flagellar protein FliS